MREFKDDSRKIGEGLFKRGLIHAADLIRRMYERGLELELDLAESRSKQERWRDMNREKVDAFEAMRNSINEYIPVPSEESDLLQGPEFSVSCQRVAEAVIEAGKELHHRRGMMVEDHRQACIAAVGVKDGRPCSTDLFIKAATDWIDDHYDLREALTAWVEGAWDEALDALPASSRDRLTRGDADVHET